MLLLQLVCCEMICISIFITMSVPIEEGEINIGTVYNKNITECICH